MYMEIQSDLYFVVTINKQLFKVIVSQGHYIVTLWP